MQRLPLQSPSVNAYSYLSQYRWGQDLIRQIQVIEEKDPIRAKDLHRRILFSDWTPSEVRELSERGLDVSRVTFKPNLLCTRDPDELANKTAVGVIDFFIEAKKQEAVEKLDGKPLKAVLIFQDDRVVGGHHCCLVSGAHEGGRILSKEYSPGDNGDKFFHLIADGDGKFISTEESAEIHYIGKFANNLFDDPTGNAILYSNQMRYRGSFAKGKKHGSGVLEKYHSDLGDYYVYYEGSFDNDLFCDGLVYSPSKEILYQYCRGYVTAVSPVISKNPFSFDDVNSTSSLSTQEKSATNSSEVSTIFKNQEGKLACRSSDFD